MNIFIYYNNGAFELTEHSISNKPNITLLHMLEMGVIKIIADIENKKAWIRSEEGTAKEVKIPEVFGL